MAHLTDNSLNTDHQRCFPFRVVVLMKPKLAKVFSLYDAKPLKDTRISKTNDSHITVDSPSGFSHFPVLARSLAVFPILHKYFEK